MKRRNRKLYMAFLGAMTFALASCGSDAETTNANTSTLMPTNTTEESVEVESSIVESTDPVTPSETVPAIPTSTEEVIPKDDYKMSLYAPSGAPGISVIDLQVNQTEKYNVETGKSGAQVKAALEAGELDAVIAPFNVGLAANKTSGYYELGAVVTWGNLYLASQNPFTLSDCTGENTILFGQASIPGKVTSYVLAQNNNTDPSDFTYLSDSTDTVAQIKLEANANKIYLIAEPALTACKGAVKTTLGKDLTIINVQEEYKKLTGQDSFPQAALFLRKETIKNHKSVVDAFLADVKASCEMTATETERIADLAVANSLFAAKPVLVNAMPRCAISYVAALDAKEAIDAFVAPVLGGVNPADEFYYS